MHQSIIRDIPAAIATLAAAYLIAYAFGRAPSGIVSRVITVAVGGALVFAIWGAQ